MEHHVARSALARLESLRNLSPPVLEQIARQLQTQHYEKDSTVVHFNDTSCDFYLIISGSVRISLAGMTGRTLTYEILPQGEMFGEVAAIDGLPRTANVIAEQDSVLGRMSQQTFRELASSSPEFMFLVLERLARLNRKLTRRLFEYHAYDVRGRVYMELLRLTANGSGEPLIITDRDMASRVGTTRENISRIHGALREAGLIERDHSQLRVLDRSKIEVMLPDCEFG
jgi:CRP/FNR family transcriptional regulator, cyclic AMP receptor protein